jgi:phosphate:Na+ symporter
MSNAMHPLRTYQPFIDLMANMSNPILGILVAAIFTALVQSSSASMGVVIVLAMQGLITLEAGIALALGANIGTCVTAGLASLGKPREAVRVATSHVLFKIIGVLIMLPLIAAAPGGQCSHIV